MDIIYEFDLLINSIKALIRVKKLNFRRVSELCQIHPSYFSRVLKGGASFSQMQIFKISEVLELDEESKEYLLLLWQKDISQNHKEKTYFQSKIEKIRTDKQKINKRIKAKELNPEESKAQAELYYFEAITALIHMHLTIPEFKKNPELILTRLNITKEKMENELQKLEKIKIIQRRNLNITEVEDNLHLPAEAKISSLNHINWRLKSIQNIEARNIKKNDYHFSAAFSADEETKEKIKKILLDTIVQIGELVKDCEKPKDVYHLGFDLF